MVIRKHKRQLLNGGEKLYKLTLMVRILNHTISKWEPPGFGVKVMSELTVGVFMALQSLSFHFNVHFRSETICIISTMLWGAHNSNVSLALKGA